MAFCQSYLNFACHDEVQHELFAILLGIVWILHNVHKMSSISPVITTTLSIRNSEDSWPLLPIKLDPTLEAQS